MMVVTSGPTGGGGLQLYGVLKGKKIYTIYLPMPDKNWILQYCARESSAASQDRERPSVEIRLESPIVPPAAVEQFDFRRPPVSESDANRRETIILQGVIGEDGSVGELKVLQGLHETVDQAALAAFSRWKFRPAQRSMKPIAVEILVGIPVILPAK
jgi:TonB family protein